jgi:hypothetical protein
MAPSFSMTLRIAVFHSCLTVASCTTIPARITRAPTTMVNKSGPGKEQASNQKRTGGIIRLTVEILRQLGVGVLKLRRLLGHPLELVCNLGKLTACRRQVHCGRARAALQLRHSSFERRLVTSGGLGGISGGGLARGRSGIGPLSGHLRRRSGCSELLNLSLGKCKP